MDKASATQTPGLTQTPGVGFGRAFNFAGSSSPLGFRLRLALPLHHQHRTVGPMQHIVTDTAQEYLRQTATSPPPQNN